MRGRRLSRVGLAAALAGAALALSASRALAQDSLFVECVVFHDLNANGVRGAGEPGMPGIRITNGVHVFTTDANGEVSFHVDLSVYRFATMTVPAGYWPTTPFYRRPLDLPNPPPVTFGLKTHPGTATDPVRWIHISDTHVNELTHPWSLDEAMAQIEELPDPPVMIFNTGDLVEKGSVGNLWANYLNQAAVTQIPKLHVVGNHDTVGTATPLKNYEQYVGPPYYSFEMGSWHYIAWNSEPGSPAQTQWLLNDWFHAPPGSHLALFQHRMSTAAPEETRLLWQTVGIENVFSGHWHAIQFAERSNGFRDFNLSWTVVGPIDRTPRLFGIVESGADGEIAYELRRLGVDHRSRITSPTDGESIPDDVLPVIVQAYDTSARVSQLSASVSGPGGSLPATALFAEGISMWRANLDAGSLPNGSYTLEVTGDFEDGVPISMSRSFEIERRIETPPSLGADWPMFRRGPAGSSFVAEPLTPPLELAWTTPIPGMVGLNSPVVANGKVFLGSRAETGLSDAGITACDAETGAVLWFRHIPGGIGLAPAVAGNVVIATALSDSIYGLSADTGDPLWSIPRSALGGYDFTAPIFEGPIAWVGGEPRARQIEWATGQVQWESEVLGNAFVPLIYSAPAVGVDRLFYGLFSPPGPALDRGFTILDRVDGYVRFWEDEGAWRSPIVSDDRVYVVGAGGSPPFNPLQQLTARREDGSAIWIAGATLRGETASPALGHGTIVTSGWEIAGPGVISGFRASDGFQLWTFNVGGSLLDMIAGIRGGQSTSSTPAIADSVVYVGSLDGNLYAIDLGNGDELWRYDVGTAIASSPAISGDFVFVAASDGHLYAFSEALPGAVTPVPEAAVSDRFSFAAPSPSPSRDETFFAWTQPSAEHVRLRIFDVRGRLVATIVDERLESGPHRVSWRGAPGSPAPAGVYFARLEVGESSEAKKFVRLRP